MPGGRPLKFETPEALEAKIQEYFDSLVKEKWELQNGYDAKGKRDRTLDKWVPVKDRFGEIVTELDPEPTITGLAVYLDTSRKTLMEIDHHYAR